MKPPAPVTNIRFIISSHEIVVYSNCGWGPFSGGQDEVGEVFEDPVVFEGLVMIPRNLRAEMVLVQNSLTFLALGKRPAMPTMAMGAGPPLSHSGSDGKCVET
jgi:hypothetical protein